MAISLTKGQKINLQKDNGQKLTNIFIGLNWGAIDKKPMFGFLGGGKEAVDLDASAALYDEDKNLIDIVYFGNLKSKDGAIIHSGDDLVGDTDGDDGLDNEVIGVSLDNVSSNVTNIVFILNSYKGQDFATVPYARIRIYEGSPNRVDEVFATFDIAGDSKFSGYVAMIMGKAYKKNGEWKFSSIGEPTKDKKLQDTVNTVKNNFL